jgi:hypothetical protein
MTVEGEAGGCSGTSCQPSRSPPSRRARAWRPVRLRRCGPTPPSEARAGSRSRAHPGLRGLGFRYRSSTSAAASPARMYGWASGRGHPTPPEAVGPDAANLGRASPPSSPSAPPMKGLGSGLQVPRHGHLCPYIGTPSGPNRVGDEGAVHVELSGSACARIDTPRTALYVIHPPFGLLPGILHTP